MSSNVFIIGVNKKIVEILRFKKHTPIHKIYKHKKVGIAIDTINFSGQCSGVFIFWTKKDNGKNKIILYSVYYSV